MATVTVATSDAITELAEAQAYYATNLAGVRRVTFGTRKVHVFF